MTQFVLVLVVIAAAVAYLGWTAWRTVAGTKKGCGSGCGKCVEPTPNIAGRRALPQV
jgi:bacterioferritin-associated ferredoxin